MLQNVHDADAEAGHATPLKAVRLHCLWCCNGSSNEVKLCAARSCPLWLFRHGHRPNADDGAAAADRQLYPLERPLTGAAFHGTALRAIRRRCIDCSAGDAEARSCRFGPDHPVPCSLHPYRLGRNPNINRSDEWKRAAAERLTLARATSLPKFPMETPDILSDQGPEEVRAGKGQPSAKPLAL